MNTRAPHGELIYFADPMCSWCYGFGPALSIFLNAHPALNVQVVMGGLRPYTQEPMQAAQKQQIRGHWQHVQDASGQIFNDALLMRDGFIYDTEPACRAVVTARWMKHADVLAVLKAVSTAFYRDARDITQAATLADVAAENGLDRAAFISTLDSPKMREMVKQDFAFSQSLGVQGFPTLCARIGNELHVITNGYASITSIEDQYKKLRDEIH